MERKWLTEDMFALAAKYYRYRTPYFPQFFKVLSERTAIDADSSVLDLCTGRGEVAHGMTEHAGRVTGVEISEAMLQHAIANDKVEYINIDVNSEAFVERFKDSTFTHITAGRALHWVNDEAISWLSEHVLTEGGSILSLHSRFTKANSWWPTYLAIVRKYATGQSKPLDRDPAGRMRHLGFSLVDKVGVGFKARIEIRWLLGEMLSRSLITQQLEEQRLLLLEELVQALDPFLVDGKLDASIANTAEIYQRSPR